MIDFHSPVFFAPAVVGLFTDTQLTGSLANGLALGDENLCLPEMTDDLFCGITFSCHDDPFLITQFLTIELGTFQGVRSIRSAVKEDAALNAIVLLDFFAKSMPYALEDSLEEIHRFYRPFIAAQTATSPPSSNGQAAPPGVPAGQSEPVHPTSST